MGRKISAHTEHTAQLADTDFLLGNVAGVTKKFKPQYIRDAIGVDTSAFTELTGTSWDGSLKYKTALTAPLAISLVTTNIRGILNIEGNATHALTVNGVDIPINATTRTSVGYTRSNGKIYFYDKDGKTIEVPELVADTTAPTVSSATAINANTIRIVFNESIGAITTAGWSFKQNGTPITPDSVSGATTTWDFVVSETIINTDTILRTYNSGTGSTTDLSSNELVSFTDQAVTNSIISGTLEAINWQNESNTTDAGSGTLNGNSATLPSGAVATKKIVGNGYVKFNIGAGTNGQALVIAFQETNNIIYEWVGGTNPLLAALYYYHPSIFKDSGNPDTSPNSLGAIGSYTWLMIERNGDDIIYKASIDNTTYDTLSTEAGVLAGISELFIKALFAVNSASASMVTAQIFGDLQPV